MVVNLFMIFSIRVRGSYPDLLDEGIAKIHSKSKVILTNKDTGYDVKSIAARRNRKDATY